MLEQNNTDEIHTCSRCRPT